MLAGGLEFVSDEAQLEEPAAEGVLRVVCLGSRGAGALRGQRLVADRQAELDVALDLPRVEGAVEGAELDGALLPHRVEVEQAVAAAVVVLAGVPLPVAGVVPKLREGFHGLGLGEVQPCEEDLVDRPAPAGPPLGVDGQRLGQQVLLRVDDVDQVPEGPGGVAAQPDVDVDAAVCGVGLRAGLAEGAHQRLHRFDVLPAADGADHLGLLVVGAGDAGVAHHLPHPAVRHADGLRVVAAVVGCAGGRAEVCGDDRRRLRAEDAVHFQFDAECLVFHGCFSFSVLSWGCAPRPGRDLRVTHTSL